MSTPIRINTKPTPAQVKAIIKAGPGATVHHPMASSPGRRKQLAMALGRAGVPHRLVRTLGWSSAGAEPAAAAAAILVQPEPILAPPRRRSARSPVEPDQMDTLSE